MEQDIQSVFTKFLLDNNAYSQYVINLLESRKVSFEEFIDKLRAPRYYEAEQEFINFAFTWNKTSEGFSYWHKLDTKWRKVLEST